MNHVILDNEDSSLKILQNRPFLTVSLLPLQQPAVEFSEEIPTELTLLRC